MKRVYGHLYYNVEEISEELGLCIETVRRLFRSKQIKGIKIGRGWHATKESIKEYLIKIN